MKKIALIVSLIVSTFLGSLMLGGQVSAADGTIKGMVVNDVNANGRQDPGEGAFPNLAVMSIYREDGTYDNSKTSDASGQFVISIAPGTYYLTMHNSSVPSASTVAPGLIDKVGVRLEQTFASAGTGGGNGSGPVCVGAAPGYAQRANYTTAPSEWAVGTTSGGSSGTCFGGRQTAVSNTVTSGTRQVVAPNTQYGTFGSALNTQEHVMKLVVPDGGTINGVTFGMSADVAVNTNPTGQGSIWQFFNNARLIDGQNSLHFVPGIAPTNTSPTGAWWRVNLTTALPTLDGDASVGTTIDGRAYSSTDGTTELAINPGGIVVPSTVGRLLVPLAPFSKPVLELVGDVRANNTSSPLINVASDTVKIQHLALNASVNATDESYLVRQTAGSGIELSDSLLGYDLASSQVSQAKSQYGVQVAYSGPVSSTGVLKHNLLATNDPLALQLAANVQAASPGDWTLQANAGPSAGIKLGQGTKAIRVSQNDLNGVVIQDTPGAESKHQITDNTITRGAGVSIKSSSANTLSQNVIQYSSTSGVSVDKDSKKNRISQNNFGFNGGNAIDLNADGVSRNLSNCQAAGTQGANNDIAAPTPSRLSFTGSSLKLSGGFCSTGTYDIEVYIAASGTGDGSPGAGEGLVYLATIPGVSGGNLTGKAAELASLLPSQAITMLAINTATGDTSEFSTNTVLLPASPVMTPDTDTGISPTDGITSLTQPRFTGVCAPGDTMTLVIDGQKTASSLTCTAPTYALTAPVLADGSYQVAVTASNQEGTSDASDPQPITIDSTTPAVPGVVRLSPLSDSGRSNSDGITSVTKPFLIGTCQTGKTINLYVNQVKVSSQVCVLGAYLLVPPTDLGNGQQTLSVTSGTLSGLESAKTQPATITIDAVVPTAPVITSLSPTQPAAISSLKGLGSQGMDVTVKDSSGRVRCTALVASDGTWNCQLDVALGEGSHSMTGAQTSVSGMLSPDGQQKVTTIDNSDGVDTTIENAAPNNGDANGDGIPDAQQSAVAAFKNPLNGSYNTLVIDNKSCVNITGMTNINADTLPKKDGNNRYQFGLWDFSVQCFDFGASTKVKMYLDKQYDTSAWMYRKYNKTTGAYTDMSPYVQYGSAKVGTGTVTTISFTAVDGGLFDEDGVKNGIISDPSGPAVVENGQPGGTTSNGKGTLPATGVSAFLPLSVAGLLVGVGLILLIGRLLIQRRVGNR